MTYDAFNAFCGGLPGATYVTQWGGAHVWKIGGKVFAIGGWNGAGVGIVFKVGAVAFEVLKDMPGLRPAPYMASRGLKWIQQHATPGLTDEELRDHLQASYDLVASRRSAAASQRGEARNRRAAAPGNARVFRQGRGRMA